MITFSAKENGKDSFLIIGHSYTSMSNYVTKPILITIKTFKNGNIKVSKPTTLDLSKDEVISKLREANVVNLRNSGRTPPSLWKPKYEEFGKFDLEDLKNSFDNLNGSRDFVRDLDDIQKSGNLRDCIMIGNVYSEVFYIFKL